MLRTELYAFLDQRLAPDIGAGRVFAGVCRDLEAIAVLYSLEPEERRDTVQTARLRLRVFSPQLDRAAEVCADAAALFDCACTGGAVLIGGYAVLGSFESGAVQYVKELERYEASATLRLVYYER